MDVGCDWFTAWQWRHILATVKSNSFVFTPSRPPSTSKHDLETVHKQLEFYWQSDYIAAHKADV